MSKKYILEGVLQRASPMTKNRPYDMKQYIKHDKRKLHLAIKTSVMTGTVKEMLKGKGTPIENMKCTGKPFAVIRKITYSEEQFLRIAGISPSSICKKCLKKIESGIKVGYSTGIL